MLKLTLSLFDNKNALFFFLSNATVSLLQLLKSYWYTMVGALKVVLDAIEN